MKRIIPPYYTINWDFNHDSLEFLDIMPYLVDCWKKEKKRKYKLWNLDFGLTGKTKNRTKMPETFDEFKRFILDKSMYNFWARCEYEVIVTGWPQQKKEHKLDVYQQIKANINVITKHFMDYINS